MFMHNGQVGGWKKMRRHVESMISDMHYPARAGTSDSEALFLAALSAGLEEDPVGAMRTVLGRVKRLMRNASIEEPLRFTAALTDGETLFAFRWSCDDRPPTLYYREREGGLLLVSEPIDDERGGWRALPCGATLVAECGIVTSVTAQAQLEMA